VDSFYDELRDDYAGQANRAPLWLDTNGATHCPMDAASQNRTPNTQLFRDVFNASPIGIAVENLEGQPLFVNPAFCSMLGFGEEELRGKHCVDFSPPETRRRTGLFFKNCEQGR
jgi:PAS domain-containing protein